VKKIDTAAMPMTAHGKRRRSSADLEADRETPGRTEQARPLVVRGVERAIAHDAEEFANWKRDHRKRTVFNKRSQFSSDPD